MLERHEVVKKLQSEKKESAVKTDNNDLSIFYEDVEQKLKNIMGTKVLIHQKDKEKGKIEIEYYSSDELERIVDLFQSIHQTEV